MEVKVKYKINLSELEKCTKQKTLVAIIGTEKQPVYALFFCRGISKDTYYISVEDKEKELHKEWVGMRTVLETAKNMIAEYVSILEDEIKYGIDDEDADDDVNYYCNNPDCAECGLVTEPLRSEAGLMLCPSCGGLLDEEEKYRLGLQRVTEIAAMLITIIELNLDKVADADEILEDFLAPWGIDADEIEAINDSVGESFGVL